MDSTSLDDNNYEEDNLEKMVQDALSRARKVMGDSVNEMTASALAKARKTLSDNNESPNTNTYLSGGIMDIQLGSLYSPLEKNSGHSFSASDGAEARIFTFNSEYSAGTDDESAVKRNLLDKSVTALVSVKSYDESTGLGEEESWGDMSEVNDYIGTLDDLIEAERLQCGDESNLIGMSSSDDITVSDFGFPNISGMEKPESAKDIKGDEQRQALAFAEKEAAAALLEVEQLKAKQEILSSSNVTNVNFSSGGKDTTWEEQTSGSQINKNAKNIMNIIDIIDDKITDKKVDDTPPTSGDKIDITENQAKELSKLIADKGESPTDELHNIECPKNDKSEKYESFYTEKQQNESSPTELHKSELFPKETDKLEAPSKDSFSVAKHSEGRSIQFDRDMLETFMSKIDKLKSSITEMKTTETSFNNDFSPTDTVLDSAKVSSAETHKFESHGDDQIDSTCIIDAQASSSGSEDDEDEETSLFTASRENAIDTKHSEQDETIENKGNSEHVSDIDNENVESEVDGNAKKHVDRKTDLVKATETETSHIEYTKTNSENSNQDSSQPKDDAQLDDFCNENIVPVVLFSKDISDGPRVTNFAELDGINYSETAAEQKGQNNQAGNTVHSAFPPSPNKSPNKDLGKQSSAIEEIPHLTRSNSMVSIGVLNDEFEVQSVCSVPAQSRENNKDIEILDLEVMIPEDRKRDKMTNTNDSAADEHSIKLVVTDANKDTGAVEDDNIEDISDDEENYASIHSGSNSDEYTEETVSEDDSDEYTEETVSDDEDNFIDETMGAEEVAETCSQEVDENHLKKRGVEQSPWNANDTDKRLDSSGTPRGENIETAEVRESESVEKIPDRAPATNEIVPGHDESPANASVPDALSPGRSKNDSLQNTDQLFAPTSVAASPSSTIKTGDEYTATNANDLGASVSKTLSPSRMTPTDKKKITFRHVYPLPGAQPKPRNPSEIVKEHQFPENPVKTIWKEPKSQLEQLFITIQDESIARRSNACGALKVLSTKASNRIQLARTSGTLRALTFAISKRPPPGADYDTGYDALVRATTVIMHLSIPIDNRQIVFNFPKLLETLVYVIQTDIKEPRVNCCTALTYLAKTLENREKMIKVPNLVDALTSVVSKDVNVRVDTYNTVSDDDLSDNERYESKHMSKNRNRDHANDGESVYSSDGSTSSSLLSADSPVARKPVKKSPKQVHKISKQRVAPDGKLDEYLTSARLASCAVLTHLVKHCPNAAVLGRNGKMIRTLINVSQEFNSPLHQKCIEMLCHLSRFQANSAGLSSHADFRHCLAVCGSSHIAEDRMWTMRTIQNLTTEGRSKLNLATPKLLTVISASAMSKENEEHVAAVSALLNIATEPGAIVPLTNTKNVVATLVHLAHNSNCPQSTRIMACEALGTIGLWLQTLSGTGTVPLTEKSNTLPSHTCSGWRRWD